MTDGKLEAVIWDMDGVIADTAAYHFQAWREVFRKREVDFTEADFKRQFGQRNDTIIRTTLGESTPREEVETIAGEKEADYRRRITGKVKPLPGAIALLKSLGQEGIRTAIASSAPPENIALITASLGIADCFQAVVSGREVSRGKPSPQGFLLAAERLGVSPERCLVIEDAVAGVAAAKRAGMKCLAVTTTHPAPSLSQADMVTDSLEQVGVAELRQLFQKRKD